MEAKTILVTGGAGFIGSEVVRQLAASGRAVCAVDNLVNGKRTNVEEVLSPSVRLEVCDIRNLKRMEQLLRGVEIVIHMACLGVRHSIHSPRENHEVNATATLDLLAASRKARVQRFVYVSSSEVYGTARTVPMTEEHPTYPQTVYGAAKLAGECYTRAYFEAYGYPTTVVRPFNAYGPRSHHEGDCGEVIPKFLLRAMAGLPMIIFGDGTNSRDFTFVSDTAAGIIAAACSEQAIGQTLNLAQGVALSIEELAKVVAEVVGTSSQVIHDAPRPGDVLHLCGDANRARISLPWRPTVLIGEGLLQLKRWYEQQGVPPAKLLEQEIVRNWEVQAAHV